MDIKKSFSDDAVTLAVSGYLNTATARDLEHVVDEVLEQDPDTDLTFDFANLDYISSAGLRVLMGSYKSLIPHGGSLKVINSHDSVREVFEITGLTDILEID